MAWNMCGPKPAEKKLPRSDKATEHLMWTYCCLKVLMENTWLTAARQRGPMVPQVFKTPPLFSVKLGAILTQYTSLVTDKCWWGTGMCV